MAVRVTRLLLAAKLCARSKRAIILRVYQQCAVTTLALHHIRYYTAALNLELLLWICLTRRPSIRCLIRTSFPLSGDTGSCGNCGSQTNWEVQHETFTKLMRISAESTRITVLKNTCDCSHWDTFQNWDKRMRSPSL